jgi:hypothetical protein
VPGASAIRDHNYSLAEPSRPHANAERAKRPCDLHWIVRDAGLPRLAHAWPAQPRYQVVFGALSRYFAVHGLTTPDTALHAKAEWARFIQQQAAFLGFLDCFWLPGCACLIGAPLVFFARKFKSGGPGSAHLGTDEYVEKSGRRLGSRKNRIATMSETRGSKELRL